MDEARNTDQLINTRHWRSNSHLDQNAVYAQHFSRGSWTTGHVANHNGSSKLNASIDNIAENGNSNIAAPASTTEASSPSVDTPISIGNCWQHGTHMPAMSGWWHQLQLNTDAHGLNTCDTELINNAQSISETHVHAMMHSCVSADTPDISSWYSFVPGDPSLALDPANGFETRSYYQDISPVYLHDQVWSHELSSGADQWVNHLNTSRTTSTALPPSTPVMTSLDPWTQQHEVGAVHTQSQDPMPFHKPGVFRSDQHTATREALRKSGQGGKAKRRGPLKPEIRDKVEEVRDMNACWRCRKYKKSCNGPGTCDSCLIPKFKIWPSAIGCRRENLESMVRFLIPVQLEEGLTMLPPNLPRGRTWRTVPKRPLMQVKELETTDDLDIWTLSKKELVATCYFGPDYVELADIAMNYQKSLPEPNKCLEAACQLVLAMCNWYKCLVDVPDSPPPIANIVQCGTAIRTITRRTFAMIQQLCLSTKRTDWFPAFLSGLLVTISATYFMDVIVLMPASARNFIWHDVQTTRMEVRSKSYELLVDLLHASTKGINPLTIDCFDVPSDPTTKLTKKAEKIRAKEREVLLGSDKAALHGLLALRQWQVKYQEVLTQGKHMFVHGLVGQKQIKPIAGVWKLFEIT